LPSACASSVKTNASWLQEALGPRLRAPQIGQSLADFPQLHWSSRPDRPRKPLTISPQASASGLAVNRYQQRRTALAETSDINKLRHQTLSMRFAVINKAESMMLTSGNCTASNCQTTRQKLRGLVTYGPRQSLTSFAASKDEFLRNKIHIKLARFNEHRQCRKNRIACFIADVVILCRLVFGRHDF
jgi:hypothetical protein